MAAPDSLKSGAVYFELLPILQWLLNVPILFPKR